MGDALGVVVEVASGVATALDGTSSVYCCSLFLLLLILSAGFVLL